MQRRVRSSDAGVSLIEVVVAVMVLSIGVVAGFQSLGQARRGIGAELPRLVAHQVALNRAEEMQILGAAVSLPGAVEMGRVSWVVETKRAVTAAGLVEARIKVSAPGQPGAVYTAYVQQGPAQ